MWVPSANAGSFLVTTDSARVRAGACPLKMQQKKKRKATGTVPWLAKTMLPAGQRWGQVLQNWPGDNTVPAWRTTPMDPFLPHVKWAKTAAPTPPLPVAGNPPNIQQPATEALLWFYKVVHLNHTRAWVMCRFPFRLSWPRRYSLASFDASTVYAAASSNCVGCWATIVQPQQCLGLSIIPESSDGKYSENMQCRFPFLGVLGGKMLSVKCLVINFGSAILCLHLVFTGSFLSLCFAKTPLGQLFSTITQS